MAEWIISGNPSKYDVVGAFHELKKIDWTQSANISAGDVIYIYVSGNVKAIQFKCRANKVDIKVPDIDDQKFNISGEYDGHEGRYMELELIEEFSGTAYTREELMKHGFQSPMGPIKMPASVKTYLSSLPTKTHTYGQFDSWTIIDEVTAIKKCDKSFFEHKGSGVPAGIQWFFDAEDMENGTNKEIELIYESSSYDARINKEKLDMGRTRIFWSSELAEDFNDMKPEEGEEFPEMTFKKIEPGKYKVNFGEGEITKKYTVNQSVWIAAALLSMEVYDKNPDAPLSDYYFKQSLIVHRAQPMADKNVDGARCSLWCCAGREKNANNYLSGDLPNDPSPRRLTGFHEYPEKTHPDDLEMDDILYMNGKEILMEELFYFVENQYPGSNLQKTDINYISVLDYLEHNREVPYSNPDSVTDPTEKARLLEVKQKGQDAAGELKKMATLCQQKFGLDKCLTISWLDGSNTKTRKYLWVQMKYSDRAEDPTSISIFVEMQNATEAAYRISLEIKNDGTDKSTMARYHSHLDLPLNQAAGLVYVSGSNEWGRPEKMTESQDQIRADVEAGKIRKVQVSRYIDQKPDQTNEYFEKALLAAVEALIPYYNHVVGKEEDPVDKWFSLVSQYLKPLEEYVPVKEGNMIVVRPKNVLPPSMVFTVDPEWPGSVLFEFTDEVYEKASSAIEKYQERKGQGNEKYPMPRGMQEALDDEVTDVLQTFLKNYGKDEYWPALDEYVPGISKDEWLQLLKDPEVTIHENLVMFKMMLLQGGESTCANLAETYGGTAASYNSYGRAFGERVHKKTGCPLCADGEQERVFTIPFRGRHVVENGKARYSWKLRDELKEALEEMDLSDIEVTVPKPDTTEFDKNMILYGPPGTGKTYKTAVYAVAVCDRRPLKEVEDQDYEVTFHRYEELKREGRVAFTTFHQSYGYEEFIEGIKPVVGDGTDSVGYTIADGVFKEFCKKAGHKSVRSFADGKVKEDARIWCVQLDGMGHSKLKDLCFEEHSIRIGWDAEPETIEESTSGLGDKEKRILLNFQDVMEIGDIVVTAKNNTTIDAIGVIVGDYEFDPTGCAEFPRKRKVEWLSTYLDIDVLALNNNTKLGRYTVYACDRIEVNKLLGSLEEPVRSAFVETEYRPYLFIIDEINRGNISKIFGELITLIEDTKREGMQEEASAILPYSGDVFSVPENVYILGTMNTADRSIALMDTALRRRFQFVEMMPDADVLKNIGADKVQDLDVAAMLEKINERITFLYDREHTIGHAFFTKLKDSPDIKTLAMIFQKSIIPLLQEYFYEDYQKIQLVLGDNGKTDPTHKFIKDEEVKVKSIFKGNADDVVDLPEKKYTINKDAFEILDAYKEII